MFMLNTLSTHSMPNILAAIENKYVDWKEFLVKRLTGARTLPHDFYYMVQEELRDIPFRKGMKVEVVDKMCVSSLRVVTVEEVIGGRLMLRYDSAPVSKFREPRMRWKEFVHGHVEPRMRWMELVLGLFLFSHLVIFWVYIIKPQRQCHSFFSLFWASGIFCVINHIRIGYKCSMSFFCLIKINILLPLYTQ